MSNQDVSNTNDDTIEKDTKIGANEAVNDTDDINVTSKANDSTKEEVGNSKTKRKEAKDEVKKLKAELKNKDEIINDLESKIDTNKEDLDSTKASLQRIMAEFDNYKKRTQKEKDAIYSDAQYDILKAFLPVIDNMERALVNINENENGDTDSIKQGVELVFKNLVDVFKSEGVEEIPALDEEFDPNLHEAVFHIEDEEYGENKVVEVLVKGYKLKDKVLRHSVVKVAN